MRSTLLIISSVLIMICAFLLLYTGIKTGHVILYSGSVIFFILSITIVCPIIVNGIRKYIREPDPPEDPIVETDNPINTTTTVIVVNTYAEDPVLPN
jgi:hypothetical protein